MQQSPAVKRTRRRVTKSCAECRRRKQKCDPRKEGPCGNCLRRYPPVECVGRPEQSKVSEHSRPPDSIPTLVIEELFHESPSTSATRIWVPGSPSSYSYPNSESHVPSHRASTSPVISAIIEQDVSNYFVQTQPAEDSSDVIVLPSKSNFAQPTDEPLYGNPQAFGGILTSINTLYSLPIKQTARNSELLHFFHGYVVPNLVSIDGQNVPILFQREILPWMIQSPLMPNIAIMMASATQSSEQELIVKKSSETLSIQSHVFKIINQFLKQDFNEVGWEALRAVIHLVILEFFWGSSESLWPHVKGLNQMIKLRGGYPGIKDPVLEQVLVLTDYELACCFEREISLQDLNPARDMDPPIPASYAESLKCPLITSPTTYQQMREMMNLGFDAAQILDSVRFLTLSITSPNDIQSSTTKIQNTASWLYKQLGATPVLVTVSNTPESELILDVIRTSAMFYSNCIATLSPFTNTYMESELIELVDKISAVNFSRWKEMPGVFLWILLVASPSSGNDLLGRSLRKKMAVTGMSIGMEDFGLAIACLRAFWKVQRWIANERAKEVLMADTL